MNPPDFTDFGHGPRHRLDNTREHFLTDRRVQIKFLSYRLPKPPPKTVTVSNNTTYGDVTALLNQGSSEWVTRPKWILLQTVYGPKPYWIESDGISILEDTCQTLYAVERALPYALGLVRKPHSDYPLAIFDNERLETAGETISAAFIAMDPSLKDIVGYITHYSTTRDVSNIPRSLSQVKTYNEHAHHFPTAFILTTKQPPEALNLDIPPEHPILPFLQNPFIDCRELLRQSYNLEFFPLQMIHLSTSLLHAITSLAKTLARPKPDFDKLISSADLRISAKTQHTAFSRDRWENTMTENNYPAQILEVAPLLAHNLEKLMDGLRSILESDDFDRRHQDILDQTFLELCGDYPGAAAIRRSQSTLEALKVRDQEKNERILGERGFLNRFLRKARRTGRRLELRRSPWYQMRERSKSGTTHYWA